MSEFLDIHGIVRQLTQWHTIRQAYTHQGENMTWEAAHVTQVPPLITQLSEANPASTGAGAGKPASRPAANIEALDTLIDIDLAAARWVRDLGEDDPGSTIACISKLYGLAASAHHCGNQKATIENRRAVCCAVHQIERDIRRWWTQARIVSGWDSPAWAPNNTCPMCSERRTLRIRSDDKTAMCTGCRETWDGGNIGLLAEHVRGENDDELAS